MNSKYELELSAPLLQMLFTYASDSAIKSRDTSTIFLVPNEVTPIALNLLRSFM